MDTHEPTDRSGLEALKAHLAALEGKPDEGLASLADKDDPESLRTRLTILMDAGRFSDAAALVRGRAPEALWCEMAVAVLAAAGEVDEAQRLVHWAHQQRDPLLWPSCLVALARHRYLHTFRNWAAGKPILPGELTAEEAAGVRESLNDLAPVVRAVKAQQRVLTGVEASTVCLSMEFCHILGEREEYRGLAELIWKRSPLPLGYAYAVTRKVIPPDPELPRRLREERKDSFEARRLAVSIEGLLLGKPGDAVRATEELLSEYRSPHQQEQLAHLLLQLAVELPPGEQQPVRERAESLLGGDSRYARFREIEGLLKAKRFDEALALLEGTPDEQDPTWLEFMAAVRKEKGQPGEAVDLLIRATERFPDTELLRKATLLAAQQERTGDAIRLTERLLRAALDDVPARAHLAHLLMQTGQYERAAEQFRVLSRLRPDDPAPAVNEAGCLALALRYEESLRAYEALCSADRPPLRAILGRAALLKVLNRAGEAFASLEGHRSTFWDDPDFLKAYVDLGYAARREEEAQQGFLRLHKLQAEGAIEKVLHTADLEELLGILRRQAQSEETLNAEMLGGRFPWLLAAQTMKTPAVAAFRARTCPLRWQADESAVWSRRTLYATNGYLVTAGEAGRRWLEPIRAPGPASGVVVDLSALIILYHLELLSAAADYFGECLYPSAYHAWSLSDRNRLVVHQPSRPQALDRIKSAIESGKIRTLGPGRLSLFVHEHCPEGESGEGHVYGFIDLLPALQTGRLLSDAEADELTRLAHRPSGVDADHPPLGLNDAIRIDPSGLETLEQHGLLGPVMSCFQVHVTNADRDRVAAEIQQWRERQTLWDEHAGLWDAVRKDPRFVAVGHAVPRRFSENDTEEPGDERPWAALFSTFLASERKLPLLVDDRSCQMLIHNERREATAAFATESLVEALLETKAISRERAADVYLQLLSWRYRFVVVPASIMVALAKRSLRSPPGRGLQRVARYVQDSMRDPGLFGGPEPVEPPLAIAHKLFLAWTAEVIDFVFRLWDDKEVSSETARALTDWALTECLPCPPLSSGAGARVLADHQARTALGQAFIHAATRQDAERTNGALVAVATALGLGDRDYFEELVEVLDAL